MTYSLSLDCTPKMRQIVRLQNNKNGKEVHQMKARRTLEKEDISYAILRTMKR